MSAKKLYFSFIVLLCVLFAGLFVATINVNKILTEKGSNLTQLKAKNAALEREQISLNKTAKDMQTYTDLQKITQSIVPEDKSQAQAVREIVNIADQHGIRLAKITFPASTLGNSSATSSASAQAAAAPATSTGSKNTRLSQLSPVKNIPGVYQLPITVQSDAKDPVRYDKFISFLNALERNRRTAQVSTITLEPSKENRNYLSFTLTLNNYIKP